MRMRNKTCLKSVSFCSGSYIKFVLAAVLFAGGQVLADWDAGDPALYYQLPDESDGWSVHSEWGAGPKGVADDWTAAVTAPITDIHFWGGWRNDAVGTLGALYVEIFSNDTSGPFNKPGETVWSRIITGGQYTARLYEEELQNYYNPAAGWWVTHDHQELYQYSIPNIANSFTQQAGQTYWLMISMYFTIEDWGWNTTESVSSSTAVFWDEGNFAWAELITPVAPQTPLDLAFVLVPEPATLLLFGLGVPILSRLGRGRAVAGRD